MTARDSEHGVERHEEFLGSSAPPRAGCRNATRRDVSERSHTVKCLAGGVGDPAAYGVQPASVSAIGWPPCPG